MDPDDLDSWTRSAGLLEAEDVECDAAAFGSACADPVAGVAVRLRDLVVRPAGVPGYVAEWCDR